MPNQPAKLDDPLRGRKTGKWTKYGGAILGLRKERIKDYWCCQTCGEEMPVEINPFLYALYPGEYIRVCPPCTNVISLLDENVSLETIVKIVRNKRD